MKVKLTSNLKGVFCDIRKELRLDYHVKDFTRDLNNYANDNNSVLPAHFETVIKRIESDIFKRLVLANWISNSKEKELKDKEKFENIANCNHKTSAMFDHTPVIR